MAKTWRDFPVPVVDIDRLGGEAKQKYEYMINHGTPEKDARDFLKAEYYRRRGVDPPTAAELAGVDESSIPVTFSFPKMD